jgi:hypothetical protein
MVIFDQLRISEDGKRLYIDVHINTIEYFKNKKIKSLTIVTADCTKEDKVIDQNTKQFIYRQVFSGEVKHVSLVLDSALLNAAENNTKYIFDDAGTIIDTQAKNTDKGYVGINPYDKTDFSSNLFFVFIETEGIDDPCAPCRGDIHTGVTFDDSILKQRVMNFTGELADTCNIPKQFIDFILLWNAFKSALETEHYPQAIKFYCQLMGMGYNGQFGNVRRCGCHG